MKRVLECLFIIILPLYNSYGQETEAPDWMLDYSSFRKYCLFGDGFPLPDSPEAYSMIQYSSPQANLYRGEVSIEIPFYTYSDQDFEIPVSFSYRSGGYKPNVPYGVMGLGWSLHAGGFITREVRGIMDEANTRTNRDLYKFVNKLYGDNDRDVGFPEPDVMGYSYWFQADSSDARIYYQNDCVLDFKAGAEFFPTLSLIVKPDLEYKNIETTPDVFHFNVPGHSGSFVFDSYGKAIFFDTSGAAPFYKLDASFVNSNIESFTITTDDKYVYHFDVVETSSSYNTYFSNDSYPISSTWKLSSIKAPNGRVVQYVYGERYETGSDVPFKVDEQYIRHLKSTSGDSDYEYLDMLNEHPNRNYVDNYPLESITIDNKVEISFDYMPQSSQYGAFSCGKNLMSVAVSNLGETEPELSCGFSYHNEGHIGEDYSSAIPGVTYLDSIELQDRGAYYFEYNEPAEPMPCTDTYAIDWYGFYNGSTNKNTFLPSRPAAKSGDSFLLYLRQPSFEHAKYGMLTKIIYPTGGWTAFTYEPNDYSRDYLNSVADLNLEPDGVDHTGSGVRLKSMSDHDSDGSFILSGHYAPNTLTGVERVLPSGERQRVWTDFDGRTVLQESLGPDVWVKTLFCYDISGLLRAVVTPEGVKRLSENTAYGRESDLFRDYAYVYEYDGSGRRIGRRFPSGADEYFVYDSGGNVVMRQNGLLRAQNQWIGIFHDHLGRVTSERLLTCSAGTAQDLALVRSYQDLFDDGQSPSVYSSSGGTLLLENTYDSYPTDLSSAENFSADGLGISYDSRTRSLLTSQRLARITSYGVTHMCRRVFYYDACGNVLQTVEKDSARVLRHTTVRDLLGNVLTDRQSVAWGNTSDTWQTDYTYDPRGRVLRAVGTLNGQQVSDVSYGYDSVGELSCKSFQHGGGYFHEQVRRNLQQWTVEKISPVFILFLDYHDSVLPGSTVQHGGRISAQRWEHRAPDDATVSTGGYSYSYDSLGRLTGAGYHDVQSTGWSAASDIWTEKGLTYTDNGDILTLKRYGASDSMMHDSLSFTYTGARRDGVQYDADGNVANDAVRGFTMSYNFLNLPSRIWVSEDDYMSYTWYYDGTKVSVEGYEGSCGADYIGSFVYNNDDDGLIRDIRFGDGIVRETADGVYETLYWVTDHLCSPRVAFTLDDSEYGVNVVERNDYYPFGGRWDDGSGQGGTTAASDNRYALSGKERQAVSRMGTYLASHESLLDFGARFYDPAVAIFLQRDPLAEKYYNLSPYAYCANNPVNFVHISNLLNL